MQFAGSTDQVNDQLHRGHVPADLNKPDPGHRTNQKQLLSLVEEPRDDFSIRVIPSTDMRNKKMWIGLAVVAVLAIVFFLYINVFSI